jgi:spermidine/putrescine transport system permease protein
VRANPRFNWAGTAISSGAPALWLTVFLFLPLVAVAVLSFLTRGEYGDFGRPWTLENYQRLLGFGLLGFDPVYPVILLRSLLLGFLTALGCLVAGFPLALFLGKLARPWRNLALILVIVPCWTNLLIRTYAWQIVLAPESWLSTAAAWIGFIEPGSALYPGYFAVLVAMVCDFLPFMVLPLFVSVEKLDWSLAEAAMDLGANRWNTYRHAIVPQIIPGVTAGFILVFLPATGQFVIPDLLGGARTAMLGNVIQQQFGASRDWPFGAAIAFVALLFVMAGMWLWDRKADQKGSMEAL